MRSQVLAVAAALWISGCMTSSGDPDEPSGNDFEALGITPDVVVDLTTPGVRHFNITVDGEAAMGIVGVPEGGTSDRLLVICKGLGMSVDGVRGIIEYYASEGVLVVAMDFRGHRDAFKVRTGTDDTIAATSVMHALHEDVNHTILFGGSMGGQISGMVVAEAPAGMYDSWVNAVGVTDMAALWWSWGGPAGETVYGEDIFVEETGGTPVEVPEEYEKRSPVYLAEEIAAHGLERAYMIYGSADTLVTVDHAERLYAELVAAEVPVTYYLVLTNPGPMACVPIVWACSFLPAGPAGHDAAWIGLIWEVLWDRVQLAEPPSDPSVRAVHEGVTYTTTYVPG